MNVKELVERLRSASPASTVLLLPAHCVATEAEVLRTVIVPRQPWVHERHRRTDGEIDDFYHSGFAGRTMGFNDATDEAISERVVVLIAVPDNLGLLEEPAPTGLLSMAKMQENAAKQRRDMLKEGRLLLEDAFRKELDVSKKRLYAMLGDGRLFALDIDGKRAYPAILCNANLNLKRLWDVAKIIWPAPPAVRFDLLTRKCGALGNRVPVELLENDADYVNLRRFARGWASEFSRTFVKLYDDGRAEDSVNAKPLYECAAEIDPRRSLWTRALAAIKTPGYRFPHTIPRTPTTMVAIIERHTAGQGDAAFEARIVFHLKGRVLRVTVADATSDEAPIAHKLNLPMKRPTVTEVAEIVFSLLP
ncbi:hypothetical protein A9R05_21310 [Burkholderia sp. KK1]|nr:hypothetical protein A9R05_21310 [Burkholderia sp. KK1]